jgi:asparagine synthase (glutamine-hydrolysing)
MGFSCQEGVSKMTMDHNGLLAALRKAVSELVAHEDRVAVAYSGGLDSSIIAALASEKTNVTCYTCAVEGSFDSRNARQFANGERRQFTLLELRSEDLKSFTRKASGLLGTTAPIRIAYMIPVLCVLHRSAESVVLTGSGADELFGGYAKYAGMRDPTRTMAKDLERMLSESHSLSSEATKLGKIIGFPYAAPAVIATANETPLGEKIDPTGRKIILREVAKLLGLESHRRPKKAAQYSSGVMKEMERLAKGEGLSLSQWTERTSV